MYLRLSTQRNDGPHAVDGRLRVVHRGGPGAPVIVAVGPMLNPVLHAITGLDVTVAYTNTPRPFDAAGLRELVGSSAAPGAGQPATPDRGAGIGSGPATVVLVEPYLVGTSAGPVSQALASVPHRLLTLGVGRTELRRYGDPADHARWHGLDATGLRRSITAFLAA